MTTCDYRDVVIQEFADSEAAALYRVAIVTAERDLAVAERDATHTMLRASLRCNIELTRKNDHLTELLRRERADHADLRLRILEKGEPV